MRNCAILPYNDRRTSVTSDEAGAVYIGPAADKGVHPQIGFPVDVDILDLKVWKPNPAEKIVENGGRFCNCPVNQMRSRHSSMLFACYVDLDRCSESMVITGP